MKIMGDPKRARKKYESARKEWSTERIEKEGKVREFYGLKNNREIRKLETLLSRKRENARKLLAMDIAKRAEKEKERIKDLREKAESRVKEMRQKVQEKIARIKDAKKQEAATKITNQLERVNKVWTEHFSNVLDRLDAILQKITSRTQKAKENGKDVAAVESAIQKAQVAIKTARDAVALQAQKSYVIDASTAGEGEDQEALVASLRAAFKALKEQLMADLKALRDGAMKDARTAVADALKTLISIPGVDQNNRK